MSFTSLIIDNVFHTFVLYSLILQKAMFEIYIFLVGFQIVVGMWKLAEAYKYTTEK